MPRLLVRPLAAWDKLTCESIKCRDCRKDFIFTGGEASFYKERELTIPSRCRDCRERRRRQNNTPLRKQRRIQCTKEAAACSPRIPNTAAIADKARLKTIERRASNAVLLAGSQLLKCEFFSVSRLEMVFV